MGPGDFAMTMVYLISATKYTMAMTHNAHLIYFLTYTLR